MIAPAYYGLVGSRRRWCAVRHKKHCHVVVTWERRRHEIRALVDGGATQNDNQVNYFHAATGSNVYHSRSFNSLFVTFAAVTGVYTKAVFEGSLSWLNIL